MSEREPETSQVPDTTNGEDAASGQTDAASVEPVADETEAPSVPDSEGEPPEPDEAAKLEAEHATFLETYEPVITRHPDALAAERAEIVRAEQEAAEVAAKAQADQDAEVAGRLEAQQEREAEDAAFREKHYPGT